MTDILGRAMLVNLDVGRWEGRKLDRVITDRVNKDYAASKDAGRYHKRLLGGKVESHGAVNTACMKLREVYMLYTLPWLDPGVGKELSTEFAVATGWRVLPTQNFLDFTTAIRKARQEYVDAVEVFLKEWPKLVGQARERLNGMFQATDYPSVEELRTKHYVRLARSPIPSGQDFRVDLPQKELDRLAKEVEDRVERSVGLAVRDLWTRLGDSVMVLRNKLDDGKWLRDSMVEQLSDVATLLGKMNITQDAALERIRKQVLSDLGTLDAAALRDDEKVRESAAKTADGILKQMSAFYTPAPKEEESK